MHATFHNVYLPIWNIMNSELQNMLDEHGSL